jgi:hypothetical protein
MHLKYSSGKSDLSFSRTLCRILRIGEDAPVHARLCVMKAFGARAKVTDSALMNFGIAHRIWLKFQIQKFKQRSKSMVAHGCGIMIRELG